MMRYLALATALVLIATVGIASGPFDLDRNGVLWSAKSNSDGLILTGTRDGDTVATAMVPFEIGLAGTSDTSIQVAADDLTGKVAVVWQRNWSETYSEIIVAVWNQENWERVIHLSKDLSTLPRYPVVSISTLSTPVPIKAEGGVQGPPLFDSFLNIMWWEGTTEQYGMYAALSLTNPTVDNSDLYLKNLDQFVGVGLPCEVRPPAELLEHPLFASGTPKDSALLVVGVPNTCLLQLVEVRFEEVPSNPSNAPAQGGLDRRRHRPVFGLKKAYQMPSNIVLKGARVVLGGDLKPVIYTVNGEKIEYTVANESTWSPKRTLIVKEGLTLDQAIPLVENLAR
jgi:hypothetical protein